MGVYSIDVQKQRRQEKASGLIFCVAFDFLAGVGCLTLMGKIFQWPIASVQQTRSTLESHSAAEFLRLHVERMLHE